MSAPTLETHACPACKVQFRNIGAYMNHGKNSTDCTAADRSYIETLYRSPESSFSPPSNTTAKP